MSRKPDQKPKSVHDDTERLELVFKRALEDDGEIWTPAERQKNLEDLNPIIARYRAKSIELGVPVGRPKKNGSVDANGKPVARRSA